MSRTSVIERPREVVAAFVAVGGVESEKSWRIADGRGVENETRDHGEDGGVGADAESESEDGDDGEGGFAARRRRAAKRRSRRRDSREGRVR